MVDFVEEVEERLRAERYATMAQRYLPWFAAAVGATVVGWLGVWAFDNWQNHNIGQASIAYDKGLTNLASGDADGAFKAFAPVAASAPPAYRALALMQQANIRLGQGQVAEAASLYDAASKAATNDILRDLAALRAAQSLMDTAPYPEIQTRLQALIGDKRPFSLAAREMLAMAKLQAGRPQEARGDFNALSLTLGVSQGMRARAQSAIALIDSGQGGLVSRVVQTAASLPPAGPATDGQSGPGVSGPQAPATDASGQGAPEGDASAPKASGNSQ